jgi:hypothetical protein
LADTGTAKAAVKSAAAESSTMEAAKAFFKGGSLCETATLWHTLPPK